MIHPDILPPDNRAETPVRLLLDPVMMRHLRDAQADMDRQWRRQRLAANLPLSPKPLPTPQQVPLTQGEPNRVQAARSDATGRRQSALERQAARVAALEAAKASGAVLRADPALLRLADQVKRNRWKLARRARQQP